MGKVKPLDISKREMWEAFDRVKENRSVAGADGQLIAQFEEDSRSNVCRFWNWLPSLALTGQHCFAAGEEKHAT